jgi:shikimate dehydrogenase
MENQRIMKTYGLIGFPLGHSFSKKYFTEKFKKEGIDNSVYELFSIENIGDLPRILAENPTLQGLNVTIPHKETVIPFLDELDETAAFIGAVNCIKITNGRLKGYNTDAFGFEKSLQLWLSENYVDPKTMNALILGTGGASKAVAYALQQLQISYQLVSRKAGEGQLTYEDLFEKKIMDNLPPLIINTTPIGMSPNYQNCPNIPYFALSEKHFIYDIVYNPLETLFLQKAKEYRSYTKNGLEMLHLQAEKAWQIWQD